jgi:hypothetical protein
MRPNFTVRVYLVAWLLAACGMAILPACDSSPPPKPEAADDRAQRAVDRALDTAERAADRGLDTAERAVERGLDTADRAVNGTRDRTSAPPEDARQRIENERR